MIPGGHQNASVAGHGNVVVQIVGSDNAVSIAGATAPRLRAYLEPAFAEASTDRARAGSPGYTATGRRETRLLSPYNTRSLPLQGRGDNLGPLRA